MSSAFARATRSLRRDSPSSRLYSLCVCRWTNCLAMTLPHVCAARGSAAVVRSLPSRRLSLKRRLQTPHRRDQLMPRDKRSKEWMTPLRERRLPIHRATHSVEREGHKRVLAIARSGGGLGDGNGVKQLLDGLQERPGRSANALVLARSDHAAARARIFARRPIGHSDDRCRSIRHADLHKRCPDSREVCAWFEAERRGVAAEEPHAQVDLRVVAPESQREVLVTLTTTAR